MKINKIITMATLGLVVISCTNDNDFTADVNGTSIMTQDSIVIYQQRDPLLPSEARTQFISSNEGEMTRVLDDNIGDTDAYLGRSYHAGNSILGDQDNVGSYSVINVNSLKTYLKQKDIDEAEYISAQPLKSFTTDNFSYSDYNSYESHITKTKKVHSGFKLNVMNVFSIGREKTTEKIFKSNITSDKKTVYGELNMKYNSASFGLNTGEGAISDYITKFPSQGFLHNLYFSTIRNLVETYGEFVITGYITGGKAWAFFAGTDYKYSQDTSVEDSLNTKIDASFACKPTSKNDSIKGSVGFGNNKKNSKYTSDKYGFKDVYAYLRVKGGEAYGLSMNTAEKIEDISIDLSPWLTSLSEQNQHTIIDINENGLFPLSDFMLETNFKKRFNNTAFGSLTQNPKLITPKIEIVRVLVRYSGNKPLYDVAPVLITRQGDRIILRTKDVSKLTDAELAENENAEVFKKKAAEIAAQKAGFYKLEIMSNSATRLNPAVGNPLCFDLGEVNESAMYKYTNPRTNIQYIYDREKKIAFSHFVEDDDYWILDEYGISDWVDGLDSKNISMRTISSTYKIIGL